MIESFKSVKDFLKLEKICTDNSVFRLNYKATVILLCVFSVGLTLKEYVGEPIHCIVEKDEKSVPQNVLDAYCWIHSTFTLPRWGNGRVGKDVVYPGVGPQLADDETKYHQYYQWVCFAYFFQAMCFCIPRFLWRRWEGGHIKKLVQTLNEPIVKETDKTEQKKLLVYYFFKRLNKQNCLAIKYFLCEFLNWLNVALQIYLMDWFLDGEFMTLRLSMLSHSEMEPIERSDALSLKFPILTKCTFHRFGFSGSLETIDSLCVLPLNVLNEKIFIVLFFWYIGLLILNSCVIIYRVSVVVSEQVRMHVLKFHTPLAPREQIETITKKCDIGDWFIISRLSKTIDPVAFTEIIAHIANKFDGKDDFVALESETVIKLTDIKDVDSNTQDGLKIMPESELKSIPELTEVVCEKLCG